MTSFRMQTVESAAPLERSPFEIPRARGSEVVLRVLAAGVCHTDLHLLDGFFDLGRGKRLNMAERGIRMPHTQGHETVGEVVAMGPDARDVAIGDRVLAYPWIGCGHCRRCTGGDGHLCAEPRFLGVFRDGGFATHLVVPDSHALFVLDASMDAARIAPLACAGLTAYSALCKAKPALDDDTSLVIVGAGGLGLMALALMRLMDMPPAIVIEPSESKRRAALELGACAAFDPSETGALAEGASVVIDFVGSSSSVSNGCGMVRKGGKLIVVGMFGGELDVPIPALVLRALSLEGSYVGSLAEMRELLELVRARGMPALPVARRPLPEVNLVLDAMRRGEVIGRTVLVPQAASKETM
ncbi:alcohol dehydrogenase [Caballeronia sp. LZ065]|uniref:alcohol dehydrogenase n=1 Tax=Caballeronia sp. LZ065 TaxID=3038571 RepID=UPI0028637A05|nr:alcohol dehydrogenase [Caballeronia sp. LZ065]MDR5781245.1 alcohol dehydrogenase [Caballeronia sp. LZ065]